MLMNLQIQGASPQGCLGHERDMAIYYSVLHMNLCELYAKKIVMETCPALFSKVVYLLHLIHPPLRAQMAAVLHTRNLCLD